MWVAPKVRRSGIQAAIPWQPMPPSAIEPSGNTVELLCGQPEQNEGSRESWEGGATFEDCCARMAREPVNARWQRDMAHFTPAGEKPDESYLNLVMDFVPQTVYGMLRQYAKVKKTFPLLCMKLYTYQLCRSLAYIHSLGVCHRDIKPQNLLVHPETHMLKLCDFGSAKILVKGEPNVSYICSRYYRGACTSPLQLTTRTFCFAI